MEEVVPRALKAAAVFQLASGVLNVMLVSWVVWSSVTCTCGMLTLLLGSVGGLCGMFALLLVPLGLLEIGAGVWGLLDPREASRVMRAVAWMELASLLVGGVGSAIVGFGVRHVLAREDIVVWLEG